CELYSLWYRSAVAGLHPISGPDHRSRNPAQSFKQLVLYFCFILTDRYHRLVPYRQSHRTPLKKRRSILRGGGKAHHGSAGPKRKEGILHRDLGHVVKLARPLLLGGSRKLGMARCQWGDHLPG